MQPSQSCFMPIHHFYIILKASNAPKLSISYTKPPGSKRYLKSQGIWKPRTLWLHHWICFNASTSEISAANWGVQTRRSHNWKHQPGDEAKNRVQRCNPWRHWLIMTWEPWEWSLHARLLAWGFHPNKHKMMFSHGILGSDLPKYVCFSSIFFWLRCTSTLQFLSIPWKMMFQCSFLHYMTFTT